VRGSEFGWQTAGVIFQVLGLAAAAVGIWAAWAENVAPDDSLLARIVGPPIEFVRVKVLHQKPRGVRHFGSGDGAFMFEGSAVGIAPRMLRNDAPLAVVGLFATALGTVFQYVAGFLG